MFIPEDTKDVFEIACTSTQRTEYFDCVIARSAFKPRM